MKKNNLPLIVLLTVVILIAACGGALGDRLFGYRLLDKWFPSRVGISTQGGGTVNQRILSEESVVIDVVDKVSPSVVTVGIKKTQTVVNPFENLFDPFGFFNFPQQPQNNNQKIAPSLSKCDFLVE